MKVRWVGGMSACAAWTMFAGACDYAEHDERNDAADVADGGGEVAVMTGALGADPLSGMLVEGELDYTVDEVELDRLARVVVLGAAGAASGVRVVHGPAGPVLAGPNDVVPSEAAVLRAPESAESMREEVATAAAASGRWFVSAGRLVVAEGDAVDMAWAARAASRERVGPAGGNTFVARLPVLTERLPAELTGLVGATVRVFDLEREVCIGRVTGLALEARLIHEPLGPWDPEYSEAEVLARGLKTLVANVEPLAGADGACELGVVAVGVQAESPRLFREAKPAKKTMDMAIDALCLLPEWRERQRADADTESIRWSSACRALMGRAEVRSFVSRDGIEMIMVGDGDFQAGFARGLRGLVPVWSFSLPYRPEGVVDLAGDGVPEVVMPELERAPRGLAGLSFAGDARTPTYAEDWTPKAPVRALAGGLAVPDFSVFLGRAR